MSASDSEEEIFFSIPTMEEMRSCLEDECAPIAKRMRTVFLLKQVGGQEVIQILAKGLYSPSVLLAHECAYVLGQLQDISAIPILVTVLQDKNMNAVIRHEAAEALAAINAESALDILSGYCDDECREVADTCLIAVDKLKWAQQNKNWQNESKYYSVDPAPPSITRDVPALSIALMDRSQSMFERYRAMFALREVGTEEAILALATGFDDDSAVFRHEVAYVMGQIQHPAAVDALKKMLAKNDEHPMVRHEAAEALGSIAVDSVTEMLKHYANDEDEIVKQSCDVALDLQDYWNNDEIESAIPQ